MGQLDTAIECFARLFDEQSISYALVKSRGSDLAFAHRFWA